jgi:hypothetical protein
MLSSGPYPIWPRKSQWLLERRSHGLGWESPNLRMHQTGFARR